MAHQQAPSDADAPRPGPGAYQGERCPPSTRPPHPQELTLAAPPLPHRPRRRRYSGRRSTPDLPGTARRTPSLRRDVHARGLGARPQDALLQALARGHARPWVVPDAPHRDFVSLPAAKDAARGRGWVQLHHLPSVHGAGATRLSSRSWGVRVHGAHAEQQAGAPRRIQPRRQRVWVTHSSVRGARSPGRRWQRGRGRGHGRGRWCRHCRRWERAGPGPLQCPGAALGFDAAAAAAGGRRLPLNDVTVPGGACASPRGAAAGPGAHPRRRALLAAAPNRRAAPAQRGHGGDIAPCCDGRSTAPASRGRGRRRRCHVAARE